MDLPPATSLSNRCLGDLDLLKDLTAHGSNLKEQLVCSMLEL